MKRRTLGAAGLLWVVLTTAAAAQDEAVTLRYHFQPGQELRFRLTLTADMGMTMAGSGIPAGAGVPNKIPMTMNGVYEWVQKVKSVNPDGSAVVSLGCGKMDLTTGVMGMNLQMRLGPDGKIETLMGGQPMTLPGVPPTQTLPNPLYEATIDPTGKISGLGADSSKTLNQLFGGQNLSAMFNGMPGMGVLLPSAPVKPGDTWTGKWTMKVPIAMPGAMGGPSGGAVAGSMDLSLDMKSKLAKVEDGRAIIETQMTGSVPTGAKIPVPQRPGMPPGMTMRFEKMDQSMTGTYRFNLEQGAIEGSDMDAKVAMTMAMSFPQGLTPPAGAARARAGRAKPGTTARAPVTAAAPAGMKISVDGTMKAKMDRVIAPEVGAAP